MYNKVANFNNSCTARPSEAYNFFVFNFNLALVANNPAIPVRNSTRSFSNSTLSDNVVSGSYLCKSEKTVIKKKKKTQNKHTVPTYSLTIQ